MDQVTLGWKGAPWIEMPISGDFLSISSRVPSSEGAPPRPLHGASLEIDDPSPEPPHPALKVPVRWALLQVPQTGLLWKEMPISKAFSTYPSGSPGREPSLQVPFTEFPQRDTPHPGPLSTYLKVQVDEPTPICQSEPPWREMSFSRAFLS